MLHCFPIQAADIIICMGIVFFESVFTMPFCTPPRVSPYTLDESNRDVDVPHCSFSSLVFRKMGPKYLKPLPGEVKGCLHAHKTL